MNQDQVRDALLRVWGRQTCRRPDDWPGVVKALFTKCEAHGSYRPRVELAVTELTAVFGADESPADPLDATWRAYSPLDAEHRQQLAAELLALRVAESAP